METILVTGATGAQGGSVARHLLSRGEVRVRALTRDPMSARALALKQAGAELVRGDLADPATLRPALKGCRGVFGLTNFWEHFEQEAVHGRNLIDAVRDSGVDQFVLSTLPHVHKATNGALSAPHFDIKAEMEDYARTVTPGATFVHVAFYYENFLTFFPPSDRGDGTFAFGFPQGDTPLATVAAEDVGGVVARIFERPDAFRNRVVGIVGDDRTVADYAAAMTHALGKQVVYNYVPRDVFAAFGFPGAEDLANMFEFNRLHILNRSKDLDESRALHPAMQTFEKWLAAHRGEFKLETAAAAGD